jgi:SAM-dependent methyltransferase
VLRPVWDDPELYDLENADDPEFDLGFWTGLLDRLRPRRVLELACGTGRLTAPLARYGAGLVEGFSLVGVDSSAPFLRVASSRVEGLPVTLIAGDMRAGAAVVEGPFDLVLVPFNALAYLLTAEDRGAALSGVAAALSASGGHFAFDLVSPRYDMLAEATVSPPVVRMDTDHAAPDFGVTRFIRCAADTYDASTQTLHSMNRYEIHRTDGRVEHRITDLDWHIWFPSELEVSLASAGLSVVERWGSYAGDPWSPSSRRMLWLCAAR